MAFRYWADLTSREFTELDPDNTIAVLPVGATEQHGPHLPLSVDTDLAEAVLQQAMTGPPPSCTVLILPTQPIGRSIEHDGFPGTLSLSAETLARLWMDLGHSVAASGVRKLVLFNGHGGNVSTMDIVARDLRAECGVWVAHTSWYALAEAEQSLDGAELTHGIHGGALETSAMMAIKPTSVRREHLTDFPSQGEDWAKRNRWVGVGGKPVKLGWLMRDLNEQGAAGRASSATGEIGKDLIDRAARNLLAFLEEFKALEG